MPRLAKLGYFTSIIGYLKAPKTYTGKLLDIYTQALSLCANNPMPELDAKLAALEPHESLWRSTCTHRYHASLYHELLGDVHSLRGHLPAAQTAYRNARSNTPSHREDPILIIKHLLTYMPCAILNTGCKHSREYYVGRANEALGKLNTTRLPQGIIEYLELLRLQISTPDNGAQKLEQIAMDNAERYPSAPQHYLHAAAAWAILGRVESLNPTELWPTFIGSLYGDPTNPLPNPKDIRWAYTTQRAGHATVNGIGKVLDNALLNNPALNTDTVMSAIRAIGYGVSKDSTLGQWAQKSAQNFAELKSEMALFTAHSERSNAVSAPLLPAAPCLA